MRKVHSNHIWEDRHKDRQSQKWLKWPPFLTNKSDYCFFTNNICRPALISHFLEYKLLITTVPISDSIEARTGPSFSSLSLKLLSSNPDFIRSLSEISTTDNLSVSHVYIFLAIKSIVILTFFLLQMFSSCSFIYF